MRDVVRGSWLVIGGLGVLGCNYPELELLDRASLEVPGGAYYRSYDASGDGQQGARTFPAQVGTFELDQYEVTVNRFRAFVEAGQGVQGKPPSAGAGAHNGIPGSGWSTDWNALLSPDRAALLDALKCNSAFQTWTDSEGGNERRPMNCLTWYEAMAFCIWDGGYLPTEAEWNYAAAGGSEQRAFPWSSPAGDLTLTSSRASYKNGENCPGDGQPECSLNDLLAVGSKPSGDGRWGHSDLSGNVWEWNLDLEAAYAPSCVDCAQLSGGGPERVIRGGGFSAESRFLRSGSRSGLAPNARYDFVGVRCARP